MDFILFFSFLFFEVLDLLSKMGECQVDKSILTQRTDGRQPGGGPGRQAAGSAAADSQTAAGSWTVMRQDEADLKGT